MSNPGHGSIGLREQNFTQLLPLRANPYNPMDLKKLSEQMKSKPDTVKDGGDPEENLWMPAGYTYFGQFIDHDLTFDSTSSLVPNSAAEATNLRTPRFDLDCLYGDGPGAQPFMYDETGTKLLYREKASDANLAKQDLLRTNSEYGDRAIIGDKRNDENSIVCQIQLAFVKYHNAVVDKLKYGNPTLKGGDLFHAARDQVRWTYQKLVIEDFLPRIVRKDVLENLALTKHKQSEKDNVERRAKNYALYTADKRGNLPLEFVGAAYRFGHSGVRTGYRLNAQIDNPAKKTKSGRFSIFPASTDPTTHAGRDSLLGFDALPSNQEIDDWGRFFPDYLPDNFPSDGLKPKANGDNEIGKPPRLQYAYKIDTSIVDPLGALPRAEVAGEGAASEADTLVRGLPPTTELPGSPPRPSLALLNLLRGDSYRIASGQAVARALIEKGFPCGVLHEDHLSARKAVNGKDGFFKYEKIDKVFHQDTPLWFYILAEAQAKLVDKFKIGKEHNEDELLEGDGAKTQLGWVGGRIVAEVFYGLLDSDPESYVNKAPDGWEPILGGDKEVIFKNLLKVAKPEKP